MAGWVDSELSLMDPLGFLILHSALSFLHSAFCISAFSFELIGGFGGMVSVKILGAC